MSNNFENLYFDYYTNTDSYVRTIMDLLPKGKASVQDIYFIKTIYNYLMNNISDLKRTEVSFVSSMFIDRINCLPREEISKQVDYLYNTFLRAMIYDSINRKKIFDIMNECIKVFVKYYSEYQDININGIDGIKIEKGSYR